MNDAELRERLEELCQAGKLTSREEDFAEGVLDLDHSRPLTDQQRAKTEQIIEDRA